MRADGDDGLGDLALLHGGVGDAVFDVNGDDVADALDARKWILDIGRQVIRYRIARPGIGFVINHDQQQLVGVITQSDLIAALFNAKLA